MPFFNWNPSYTVNVKEMDAQHKAMIEIINRLHEAMLAGKGAQEVGTIIAESAKYAQFHFASEEKLLTNNAYPQLAKQKAAHEVFTKKFADFQAQQQKGQMVLSVDMLNYLKDWWTNHIQGEDKGYGPFLNGKGVL
jgi:hemerythrin